MNDKHIIIILPLFGKVGSRLNDCDTIELNPNPPLLPLGAKDFKISCYFYN